MGSYCALYISNYEIVSRKTTIDPSILLLFQPSDLRTNKGFQFINIAKNIKHRLNIIGITLDFSKQMFNTQKNTKIKKLKELYTDDPYLSTKEEIDLLEGTTFDLFLKASKIIIKNNYFFYDNIPKNIPDLSLIKYIITFDTQFNSFFYDHKSLLRAFLEVVDPEDSIKYDITELIENEYYSQENIYEQVIEENNLYDFKIGEKIIILPEGSTDTYFLRESLDILYPHLKEYYSFMDFKKSCTKGGCTSIVEIIKAFIGAGIRNPIIALFDNDTVGTSAIKNLKESLTKIPDNIKIKQYPHLKIAEDYPTITKNSNIIKKMDINGRATTIEIYLSKDNLSDNGELFPIQWGKTSGQGKIVCKKKIKNKFTQQIKNCKKAPISIKQYDWTGLEAIFEMIFKEFSENTPNQNKIIKILDYYSKYNWE
ncbi:MAG: hypothetical protein GY817_03350 [bacterium]|nr:hypothetical protein [bacterium]